MPIIHHETGLDTMPFFANSKGTLLFPSTYIENFREALELIRKQGYAAWQEKTQPKHVRELAHWAAIKAQDILRQLSLGRADLEETALTALEIGMLYQRFLLWENEKPAGTWKNIHKAQKRKGRRAPEGSVREYLEGLKGSAKISSSGLLIEAQKQFPKQSQASLKRQIRRFKKRGQ